MPEKSFITLTPVANVLNLFQSNYNTITVISIKIIHR
jgi:hypothetical protein